MSVAVTATVARNRGRLALGQGKLQTASISNERCQEIEAKLQEVRDLSVVFRKYDQDHSHKLDAQELRNLLFDLNKVEPSQDEIDFIIKLCDVKKRNNSIDFPELKHAITAWREYCSKRLAMQEALEKFDTSLSGKLEKEELREYLVHLNGGVHVTDEEVEWVLDKANIFGDGACSVPELAMATSAWYVHLQEKEEKETTTKCCTIS